MFEDARQRKFDLLLFRSLDRPSREGVQKTLNHLQRLTDYGCGWKSFTEEYLDSLGPFRDALLGILACIAKRERVRISERTRAGMEKARRAGKRLGRSSSVVDVRKVRALHEHGVSYSAIAQKLSVSLCTLFRRLPAHTAR